MVTSSIQIDLGSPIDKKLSEQVQKTLFSLNVFWPGGIKRVMVGTSRYLYIHRGKILTRCKYSLGTTRRLTAQQFLDEYGQQSFNVS